MKINREDKPPILIGKRVVIGQVILAGFNSAAGVWDWLNPDNTVPALVVGGVAQVATAVAQIWAVNRYGVSTLDDPK